MKYKVGDKVRVRSDLLVNQMYGDCGFVEEMKNLKGEVVTIEKVCKDVFKYYRVKESLYNFTEEMFKDLNDNVENPKHYNTGKIEVLDFIEDQKLDFCLGNVVKYITRAKHKGSELEDLKKAQYYLNRYIDNHDKNKSSSDE